MEFVNSTQCKVPYDASWRRLPSRCPNLADSETKTYPVSVHWEGRFQDHYASMADLWTAWYRSYLEADFPRLLIRFEDQLFHAEKVMQLISECSGLQLKQPFTHLLRMSKTHGSYSSFISALYKYGRVHGRQLGLWKTDLAHATQALDPQLMQIFQYKHQVHVPHAYQRKVNGQ